MMIAQPPVPKKYFDRIWKMKVHYLRAKFRKWKDQRVYFVAGKDSFPWKVLGEEIKDPDHLPRDVIVVNAIYTGEMWRRPGGHYWGEYHERHTVMGFRDVLYEWVNRKGEKCSMTVLNHTRKRNKNFRWIFEVEEVLAGGLTLKRMRAGLNYSGRSSAGGAKATGHHDNGGEVEVSGSSVPCPKRTPAPRSVFADDLKEWENAKLKK